MEEVGSKLEATTGVYTAGVDGKLFHNSLLISRACVGVHCTIVYTIINAYELISGETIVYNYKEEV